MDAYDVIRSMRREVVSGVKALQRLRREMMEAADYGGVMDYRRAIGRWIDALDGVIGREDV